MELLIEMFCKKNVLVIIFKPLRGASFPPRFEIAYFTFFVCAKKVTKKAQPILMQDTPPLNFSLAKIGGRELNFIEHFQLSNMQDGMSRFP